MDTPLLRSLVYSGILLLAVSHFALAQWRPTGPGPAIEGQDEGITSPDGANPVAGAIESIATSPTDANVVYVGSVNGGVWKTTNAKAASPTWTALTDQALPALSIGSVAISPLNPNLIFAGSAARSSFARIGGANFGIGRSTDGGATWTVVGAAISTGIRRVLPTSNLQGGNQVVLVAADSGLFRSVDAGLTYTAVTNGIPAGSISALADDPGVATRFYAARQGNIYRSDDAGATWITPANSGFTVLPTARVLLSVHSSAGTSVVYAAVINGSGSLADVYRSVDQGANWTALGVPTPLIFPGGQGSIHGALVADKTDPNVVWISGDRQPANSELGGVGQFPNPNGAFNYSGNIFRNISGIWQVMCCSGANGSSPHADSRAMVFDADGNILYGCDGGIFKLSTPNLASRIWSSVNGNIQVTEAHNAAYDRFPKNFIEGAQDNGTSFQIMTDGFVWRAAEQGDGGRVLADADQTAHAGSSFRYSSSQLFLGFRRRTYNSNGQLTAATSPALMITAGAGAGQTLRAFDNAGLKFIQPYQLNAINASRMLIGTGNIYESLDRGETLTNLGSAGGSVGSNLGSTPIAYGGRFNGTDVPDVFYVGAGSTIKHRVTTGGAITTITYPGGGVRGLVIDPFNYKRVFVLDSAGSVFTSPDEGASWVNITGNLAAVSGQGAAIALANPDSSFNNAILYAAGTKGVFRLTSPTAAGTWTSAGTGFPKAVVWSLDYESTSKVLTAGTLGRGVYALSGGAPVPNSAVSRKNHGGINYDVPLPLVAVNGAVGIEPRNGPTPGAFTIVVTFAAPVTVTGVAVTNGTGNATMSVAGAVVTINLTGVTDAQRLGVTLNAVDDGTGAGNVLIPMGVLVGDTQGNGSVSATDVSETKAAASVGTVNAGNFRTDLNVGGTVNATDVSIVKAAAGHVLP
jgi:hypothetical protein